jgi:hypothetical protein
MRSEVDTPVCSFSFLELSDLFDLTHTYETFREEAKENNLLTNYVKATKTYKLIDVICRSTGIRIPVEEQRLSY